MASRKIKLLSFLCFHRMLVVRNILLLLFCLVVLLVFAQSSFLPPCEPVNETVAVEKEGCPKCLVFQTTICSGHCLTKVRTSVLFAWKPFLVCINIILYYYIILYYILLYYIIYYTSISIYSGDIQCIIF